MRSFQQQDQAMLANLAEATGNHANALYEIDDAEVDGKGLIECALVPLRDMVLFPHMSTPLQIGRERTLATVTAANQRGETLIAVAQLDSDTEDPGVDDLYTVGVEVAVGRVLRMPDGNTAVLAQGRRRVELVEVVQEEPYLVVRARPIDDPVPDLSIVPSFMRAVLALFEKCVRLNHGLPEEAYAFALNVDEPGWLADLVVSTLSLSIAERQRVLEMRDPMARLQEVHGLLGKEFAMLELEEQIHSQVQHTMDRGQREMYLREQLKTIQGELGEGDPWQQEQGELRTRIAAAGMPEEVEQRALKELERMAQMQPMTPEVGIIRNYIDVLLDLPWRTATADLLDIKRAHKILDANHYGLPKAKDRILEHIAVRMLAKGKKKLRQPILCFVGPPGTGKTSLGKSIAEALGRKFVRVSLGGVRDEAEIRGHRRTYIGAMPGRILQTMRKAGSVNPLFMLDEIDKLGNDFRGDPSSALLEVLDPEQNSTFSDHFLELPYDLSQVMFITTANYLGPLLPALEDRLEVIEFNSYTEEEKLEIARRYLVPRQLELNGLTAQKASFPDATLTALVREYTYESGVRNLERELASVCRKIARRMAEKKPAARVVQAGQLARLLGPPQFQDMQAERKDEVGVATGLAWTPAGGDLTLIEVALLQGKGGLQITGQVGEVMQESAQAALAYLRSRSAHFGVKPGLFEKTDVHLHVPEGGIAKDGPSAGITIATALISAFTKRKVRFSVGMTGEITLRGRVLPVGGLKEKILTARRAGLKTVIIPRRNEKDLADLPRQARKDLRLVLVDHLDDVLKVALNAPLKAVAPPAKAKAKPVKPKSRLAKIKASPAKKILPNPGARPAARPAARSAKR